MNEQESSSSNSIPPSAQALIERLNVIITACRADFDSLIGLTGVNGKGDAPWTAEDAARDHAECENCQLFHQAVAALSAQSDALAQCQQDRASQVAREAAICREADAALSAQEASNACLRDAWNYERERAFAAEAKLAAQEATSETRVPCAWTEFGDGHDYSRTGKHDPLNCRFCLKVHHVQHLKTAQEAREQQAFEAGYRRGFADSDIKLPQPTAQAYAAYRSSPRPVEELPAVHNTPAEWAMVRATVDAINQGVSEAELLDAVQVAQDEAP